MMSLDFLINLIKLASSIHLVQYVKYSYSENSVNLHSMK